MTGLRCKKCSAELKADDVNIQAAIAKCHACGIVFGFAEDVPGSAASRPRERSEVAMPAAFTVHDLGGELLITRKWFSAIAIFFVVFCIFWDGFMIVWFTIAISQGETVMAAAGSIHAAVGIGLTYFTVCSFLNKTTVKVGNGRLTVRHGPLPWPGSRDLETTNLDQLFTTEHVRRNKGRSYYTYTVNAALTDGKKVKLVKSLPEIDQALFLEQQIERRLGITDRPVAGEVPR